jgi:hypothetical protein
MSYLRLFFADQHRLKTSDSCSKPSTLVFFHFDLVVLSLFYWKALHNLRERVACDCLSTKRSSS